MKNIYTLFTIALLVCVLSMNTSSSSGAVDRVCSSCHFGMIDTLQGQLFIENLPSGYIPSETYKLNLCLVDSKKIASGFRFAASVGTLSIPPEEYMAQIISEEATHVGRTLIENDTSCWKVNWRAPTTVSEDPTFSFRATAVDADFTNYGDHGGYFLEISSHINPVNFGPFIATFDKENVHLNWKTFQEISNNSFKVERSSDGLKWEEIESIKGAGFSSTPKTYSVSSTKNTPGKWYFRLKQISINGDNSYHPQLLKINIPSFNRIKSSYMIGEKIILDNEIPLFLSNPSGSILHYISSRDFSIPNTPEGLYFLKTDKQVTKIFIANQW